MAELVAVEMMVAVTAGTMVEAPLGLPIEVMSEVKIEFCSL